ncbi:MAG: hypothetical protein GY774_05780 [Planctomycetes bacterium]|nr:hypothetical protein [Planctomycetota bacterium]
MMCRSEDKKKLIEKLLAQDPIPVDKQLHHKKMLFKIIERRIWLKKRVIGAVYILLFLAAFLAYLQPSRTDNLVHAVCWGVVSMHILLWFLVYFLSMTYRLIAEIADKPSNGNKKYRSKKTCWIITIVAICVFLFNTILLYHSFSLNNPLKAAQVAAYILWAPVFFLFWYPFGTAGLIGKIWLEHKRMELDINKPKKTTL